MKGIGLGQRSLTIKVSNNKSINTLSSLQNDIVNMVLLLNRLVGVEHNIIHYYTWCVVHLHTLKSFSHLQWSWQPWHLIGPNKSAQCQYPVVPRSKNIPNTWVNCHKGLLGRIQWHMLPFDDGWMDQSTLQWRTPGWVHVTGETHSVVALLCNYFTPTSHLELGHAGKLAWKEETVVGVYQWFLKL